VPIDEEKKREKKRKEKEYIRKIVM